MGIIWCGSDQVSEPVLSMFLFFITYNQVYVRVKYGKDRLYAHTH